MPANKGFAGVPKRVVQVSSPLSFGSLANTPVSSYLPFLVEAYFMSDGNYALEFRFNAFNPPPVRLNHTTIKWYWYLQI